ncbi:hypothetical protein GCM10023212_34130 [Luteolibacter yonseiensis]
MAEIQPHQTSGRIRSPPRDGMGMIKTENQLRASTPAFRARARMWRSSDRGDGNEVRTAYDRMKIPMTESMAITAAGFLYRSLKNMATKKLGKAFTLQ